MPRLRPEQVGRKYRKRPLVVDAVQYDGRNFFTVYYFMTGRDETANNVLRSDDRPLVQTQKGDVTAEPGDWVIRGVEGELYLCSDSVFQKTYDLAEQR